MLRTYFEALWANVFLVVFFHDFPLLKENPHAITVEPILAFVTRYHKSAIDGAIGDQQLCLIKHFKADFC